MKVRSKVLHRIPFFHQTHGRLHSFEAGELGIVDDDICSLQTRIVLLTMNDEFASNHPNIWIGLLPMRDVTIRKIGRIGRCVESVSGGVNTDETHAMLDGLEKSLL